MYRFYLEKGFGLRVAKYPPNKGISEMKRRDRLKVLNILIRNSDCKLIEFLCRRKIGAEFIKVKVGENYSTHLLKLSAPLEKIDFIHIPNSYRVLPNNYLWLTVESCSFCRTLSQLSVIVESISYIKGREIKVKIITSRCCYKRLIDNLVSKDLDIKVLSIKDHKIHDLTKRQLEILNILLQLGYLDRTKKVTLKDVATLLAVNPSTVCRAYKAGVKKILLNSLALGFGE